MNKRTVQTTLAAVAILAFSTAWGQSKSGLNRALIH